MSGGKSIGIVLAVLVIVVMILFFPSGTWRYRVTLDVDTPEGPKQGSSVVEVYANQSLGALLQNNRNAADSQTLAGWAGNAINLKLSRNDEIEADRLGLTILAEAGVHPDFAITSFRRMAARGDHAKIEKWRQEQSRLKTEARSRPSSLQSS